MEEYLNNKSILFIILCIGYFLVWLASFQPKKIKHLRDFILVRFRYLLKWSCKLLHQIRFYVKARKLIDFKEVNTDNVFPTLDFNMITEGKIPSNIDLNDKFKSDESSYVSNPIVDNLKEHLDEISIEEVNRETLRSEEPFTMPLVIDLKKIKKRKIETTNINSSKTTIIDKEAKEKQVLINKEIGYLGELYVMEFEKRVLRKYNIKRLSPSHISKEFDGYGYDIISYDEQGNKKYIEVKTTTQNETSDFYLSRNELETMHTLQNYFIYRVINFNDIHNRKLLIIDCKKEFKDNFILSEESFKISRK